MRSPIILLEPTSESSYLTALISFLPVFFDLLANDALSDENILYEHSHGNPTLLKLWIRRLNTII